MTQTAALLAKQDLTQFDWASKLADLSYAYGKPSVAARIKRLPEHFKVTELMDIEPSGVGEHYWLDITKTRINTDIIAKSLARFSDVAYRDVGYSGMKDFQAVARQWYSVWKPKGGDLNWSTYEHPGVTLNRVVRHDRKIRRGTHRANHFQIRAEDLTGIENVRDYLDNALKRIVDSGVPNYFGPQRFGRGANNLPRALAMLTGEARVKDRQLRSVLLSSARSWLFNQVVSERVRNGTWQSLFVGEPANLEGSNSVFIVTDPANESERLAKLDIHPTGPLWGELKRREKHGADSAASESLSQLEDSVLDDYKRLLDGLENAHVEYQRRAIRAAPKNIKWHFEGNDLCLSFELPKGQFATSVLRELVGES